MLMPSIFGENLFDDDWMNSRLTMSFGARRIRFMVNMRRT